MNNFDEKGARERIEKRRKAKYRRSIMLLAVLLFVVFGAGFAIGAKLFKVKNVVVSAANNAPGSENKSDSNIDNSDVSQNENNTNNETSQNNNGSSGNTNTDVNNSNDTENVDNPPMDSQEGQGENGTVENNNQNSTSEEGSVTKDTTTDSNNNSNSTDKNTGEENQKPNNDGTIKDNDSSDGKTSSDSNSNVEDKNSNNNEGNTESKPDNSDEKICYLTFDDGPTDNITPQILDVLKEKNVKATFFVIGRMAERNPEILKREEKEGHTIANHTYSHNYKYVYEKPQNLIDDVKKAEDVIKSILGHTPVNIMRFPGGSFGKTIYQQAINNMGYHYVDWNSLNGDAEALNIPADKLVERFKETMGSHKHLTVLMHDAATKQTTVQALPEIIEYIKANGYTFKTLDEAFED